MRHSHLDLLFTPEGAIIGAVTLAFTILICRPRKQHLAKPPIPASKSLVGKFRESMEMTHERWHNGSGYELSLLSAASPDERAEIEILLLKEPVTDWRIVQGLSALRTPNTIARLKSALETSRDHNVRISIIQYAGDLISPDERSAAIISALREAPLVQGLHRALQQIPDFHPREIIDAVHQAIQRREGDVAAHCAALLLFLHGKAGTIFDSSHRLFLARFNTPVLEARAAAYRELCQIIEI